MTLFRTIPFVFALAATLVSCSSDKTEPEPVGPATVEKLLTPKDDLSINMLLLDADKFEGLRFEWKSAGPDVKYELVFDKADGTFSEPVKSIETTETSYTFELADIRQLFDQNKDAAGVTAELAWRVYTTSGLGRTQSKQTRKIVLSTVSKVVVKTLTAPENNTLFNLKKLGGEVTFSWSKPVWLGNENAISYTFVIDQADGDFSSPLYSAELTADADKPAATSTAVTKEKLAELYNASPAAATEAPYELKWGVYAKLDVNNTLSEEIRTFSIIPKEKAADFVPGDPLYIGIPGSTEDGQQTSYITAGYYTTDNNSWHDRAEDFQEKMEFPYYEIFTQLKKGEKYFFYTLNDDNEKARFFKASTTDGFAETEEQDAQVEVARDGIYRIRIKADGTTAVHMREIEYIHLRFGWGGYGDNKFTDAEMDYKSKGVWNLTSYNVILKDMGNYKEDRYRFVLKFKDWSNPQGLAQNTVSTGNRPGKDQDASYWNVQLSYMGWDTRVFKYPDWLCDETNLAKWCTDVNLYMNADKGHYTHEFVNPVETKAFADGDPLYIDGTGTEAGQKMSYITVDSYNTAIGQSGEIDAFKEQDYKYEIFTKIAAGSKFYFRSATGTDFYTLNAAGTEIKKINAASEAEGTVADEGIYRIRFNVVSGKAYVAPVENVEHFFCWTSKLTAMTYEGKGVWAAKNMNIALQSTSWGFDERYKFKLTIGGEAQPFGRMSTNGDRPNASTAADYWYVQPSKPNQWDPAFKYPDELCDGSNLTRWYADLYLYMNDDKGHYTHEFKNRHE